MQQVVKAVDEQGQQSSKEHLQLPYTVTLLSIFNKNSSISLSKMLMFDSSVKVVRMR